MRPSPVIAMPTGLRREARLSRLIEARRRLASDEGSRPAPGRAWINGREVGGADERFAHIDRSHD